jgi:hypothetical protein
VILRSLLAGKQNWQMFETLKEFIWFHTVLHNIVLGIVGMLQSLDLTNNDMY